MPRIPPSLKAGGVLECGAGTMRSMVAPLFEQPRVAAQRLWAQSRGGSRSAWKAAMNRRTPKTRRRGISMLEILISLGVILVGLLGVAALLPVARFDMVTSLRADRGAACARAAMRDMIVRRMIEPKHKSGAANWFYGTAVDPSLPVAWPLVDRPVAIDPIGVAQYLYAGASPRGPYQEFPYPANSIMGAPIIMCRATLGPIYGPNAQIRLALAQRLFTSRDDLEFDLTGARTERPRQIFRLANGENGFGPATTAAEKAGNPFLNSPEQVADAEGLYSWMATVMPAPDRRQYTVSTVVFYDRDVRLKSDDLTPESVFKSELSCGIQFLGPGDAWLYVPTNLPSTWDATLTSAVRERLMELKQGNWVLLRGGNPGPGGTFKWYRVAALGDFDPTRDATNGYDGRRLVTLAGPDWDTNVNPSAGTEVGLFRGIVGVFTQTVELDR